MFRIILPQPLRGRGWGLLLVPVTVCYAVMARHDPALAGLAILLAVLLLVLAPRAAREAVPFAMLLLGGFLLGRLVSSYRGGNIMHGYMDQPLYNTWSGYLVPAVLGLFAAGLWLLVRVEAPGAGAVRTLAARWRDSARGGIHPAQSFLLLPVAVLSMELLGTHDWLGAHALVEPQAAIVDVVIAAVSLVLAFRSRIWAATLAEAGLLVLGGYGLAIAMLWDAVPGYWYAFTPVNDPRVVMGGFGEGAVLLAAGLWLAPRVMREHRGYPELAAQARKLTERVQTLTQTRSYAVDTAATELRRIERDLHDGAQARLVAVGMSLQAAERLFLTSPEAALALVAEAKQTSSRALAELRDLVRGIYPPVLADRGLGDAIRALALDTPVRTELEVDLPGQVDLPVASAVYFSVAEALANVTKHAAARTVRIRLAHAAGMLRAEVTDDGAGGADPAGGTGLAGVERRLAAFDGILAVNSPPGGPTIVVIEVPCALSSPKTSTC
jgi:signal transduction histidine kinase